MRPSTKHWVVGSAVAAVVVAALLSAGTPSWLLSQPPARVAVPRSDADAVAPSTSPRAAAAPSDPAARPSRGAAVAASDEPAGARPATPPTQARTETVFKARWGGAPGELGRKGASESSPEGPMSFSVDERGRAFVLDQVNGRVEVFDGSATRSIPLPADTFQDIALTKNDGLAVLDRLSTESVAFVNGEGRVTHEIALVGKGIAEGGDVTGLFQRPDGTWVEVKHQNLVRIADGDGNPLDERDIVQGRFGKDGVLRASKSGERGLFVSEKRPGRAAEALAKLSFDMPLWQILALETDAHGRIFLGASLVEESPQEPFDVLRAAEVVVVLEPNGAELGRVELPASTGPEESFRRVRVGADGAVYHLAYEPDGATLRRVKL